MSDNSYIPNQNTPVKQKENTKIEFGANFNPFQPIGK
tara:strand:+ start:87 stop:197 length:111 start_codon:yes stop_codon:yes gene_type:complete